jgi:cell division protein FtsB
LKIIRQNGLKSAYNSGRAAKNKIIKKSKGFHSSVYRSVLRPVFFLCGLMALASYATIMLRGPQGVGALSEKRKTVQQLQDENATLEKEIQDQRTLIDKLEHDPNTQEKYIRQRTGKTRPGDTSFVVPEHHTTPQTQ